MVQQVKRFGKKVPLVMFCVIGYAATAQQEKMDLKKAIGTALTNNRSLRADSMNITIADNCNREYAAQYRPQMNYSSVTEYNPALASQMLPGSMVGQPSKDLVPVEFGTSYYLRSGVEVTQTIFKKDVLLKMKSASLYTGIAQTKHLLTRESLVYQVAASFYALQNNAELIRSTTRDYKNMQDVLAIAKAQFDNGVLKRIDFESLQINVANTKSYLEQLETQYNDQLNYFNYLLGLPAASETNIDSSIAVHMPADVEAKSLLLRNDIRLSYQMMTEKETELRIIRAEKKPSISSYFRYSYQSQFNDAGKAFDKDFTYNTATLGISSVVPILDGKRRRTRISTAQVQLDQLKLESEDKVAKAEMERLRAAGAFRNYQQQYHITRNNLELAANVFNSRKALYAEGVSTLLELLDTERDLTHARNLYIQALINMQAGVLELHKANGTLLTQFIQSL